MMKQHYFHRGAAAVHIALIFSALLYFFIADDVSFSPGEELAHSGRTVIECVYEGQAAPEIPVFIAQSTDAAGVIPAASALFTPQRLSLRVYENRLASRFHSALHNPPYTPSSIRHSRKFNIPHQSSEEPPLPIG
jgi:hypothetical protein